MRKSILIAVLASLAALLPTNSLQAQRQCGNAFLMQQLATQQPEQFKQVKEHRQEQITVARNSTFAHKTTAQYPIPVVFHFILTQTQYNDIGQDTGIKRRVRSQLASLNRDYNRQNADSSLIPAAFKPLYAGVGIQFGLAATSSSTTISPGIELRINSATDMPIVDVVDACYKAKHVATNGLDAWDVTKYLNVWVSVITSPGGGTTIGFTIPPQLVGINMGGHTITTDEKGINVHQQALGVREFPAQKFISGCDLGRTMTHEAGHYFEMYHTWGDDGGLCPTTGGLDDDISDTPPEASAMQCVSGVCPTFPKTDACSNVSPGVMFMNFMDYVDDRAMQMFTAEQCSVMQFFLQNESWSLTQNPDLVGISEKHLPESNLRVSPNPARSFIRIELVGNQHLQKVELINTLGQSVYQATVNGNQPFSIQRQDWAPGVYYLHCQFAEGIISKKIVFE